MPQNTPLNTVMPLISTPRLASYVTTFKPLSDHELYGIYIWSQLASGAIYPLMQNLEITLRNAIDAGARKRFGLMWWNNPLPGCNNRRQKRNIRGVVTTAGTYNQSQTFEYNRRIYALHPVR